MASTTIRREWPDGDVITVCIEVAESFPDAVDECRAAAVRAFGDALGVAVALDEEEE